MVVAIFLNLLQILLVFFSFYIYNNDINDIKFWRKREKMNFIETIKERARQEIKTIVLPEAEDIRTLKATEVALKEKYANIILVGNEKKIKEKAETNNKGRKQEIYLQSSWIFCSLVLSGDGQLWLRKKRCRSGPKG